MSDDRGSKENPSAAPSGASIAPGAKPRSIQPPAQAHEEEDWDADEATTIFNPKAMLEAARNAAKSQAKEQSAIATPVQPKVSAAPNDSPAIDASPASSISSPANAAVDVPVAPSPSTKPAPDAPADATREPSVVPADATRSTASDATRKPSAVSADATRSTASDTIAPARHHRVGSHTEKTSPSTRAFAAVQRAAAPRADQYVWLAAGALLFAAGAWFALRSNGAPASRSQSAASTEQVSSERSTSLLKAAQPPSSSAQAAAREIEAQRLPQANHVAAASGQKTSSDEMTTVTVTAVPAQARFYYKGKPVGHSPMRVELKPGERRSFELGYPGYQTRKVTVDGTSTSMKVTMSPEPSAPAAEPSSAIQSD